MGSTDELPALLVKLCYRVSIGQALEHKSLHRRSRAYRSQARSALRSGCSDLLPVFHFYWLIG